MSNAKKETAERGRGAGERGRNREREKERERDRDGDEGNNSYEEERQQERIKLFSDHSSAERETCECIMASSRREGSSS